MNETIKLRLHPDFFYKNYFVGNEKVPTLVVDNFLNDPQMLIKYCIDTNSFNNADSFYPGLRMPAPELYIHAIRHYLGDLIEEIFGLKKDAWRGGRSVYSMVVTPPRQMKDRQCVPHVDSFNKSDLACVHYLCGATKGGTSLYRHRKTGYEIINDGRIARYNQVAIEEGILNVTPKSYMNGSNKFFEQIACVDALFNRFVMYPANVLHSGNIAPDFDFDPNPNTGRLTLNSFIYSKTSTAI
ncbi:MAG: hypothetical protein EOO52_05295 [Gammaproteobacteria bacterium]|nr:MAG: hypothetical protein EOO52_05295 [Gammaproteobacteria bacterium]